MKIHQRGILVVDQNPPFFRGIFPRIETAYAANAAGGDATQFSYNFTGEEKNATFRWWLVTL